MILRTTAVLVAAAGLLMIPCGCAPETRSVSFGSWQKNVEHYVQEQGDADPASLRDLKLPDGRPGYGMLGADRTARATDASGVLLGFRQVNGGNWFFYLVGLVQKQKVTDIRLAALRVEDGQFQWLLGDRDHDSLRRYQNYNDGLWRSRFPQGGSPAPAYLGFPGQEDLFELSGDDAQITATHAASGAVWELNIAPPTPR